MKYIIFLLSLFFLIYSEIPWAYYQCLDDLKHLNLICHSLDKDDNGIEFCLKWEINNPSLFYNLPKECFNKEYIFELNIKYLNSSLKQKVSLFIDFSINQILIDKDILEYEEYKLEFQSKDNDNIKKCFKNYIKFDKTCANTEIIYAKEEKLWDELTLKENSKFCMNLLNKFDKDSISKFQNIRDLDFNNLKIKFGDYNLIDFGMIIDLNIDNGNNNTYKYKQSKNDDEDKEYKKDELEYKEQNYNDYDENDEIYKDNKNELEFEEQNNDEFNGDKKKNGYDNDLEMEDNRERKDCVEYGLEGNYIICTKYE